jgi:hypothetical protein
MSVFTQVGRKAGKCDRTLLRIAALQPFLSRTSYGHQCFFLTACGFAARRFAPTGPTEVIGVAGGSRVARIRWRTKSDSRFLARQLIAETKEAPDRFTQAGGFWLSGDYKWAIHSNGD